MFCMCDYDTGGVYGCDDKIEYVSKGDRRTYRGYDVRLRASAMTLDQYYANCTLYIYQSQMHVTDSRIYRAS